MGKIITPFSGLLWSILNPLSRASLGDGGGGLSGYLRSTRLRPFFLRVAWESLDWQPLMKQALIRPPNRWLTHSILLTLHCFCHGAWHRADLLIRWELHSFFFSHWVDTKKKKIQRRRGIQIEGEEQLSKSACVRIYWSMNQYGFSYTKGLGCHREWVSITSTWNSGAAARSSLIASHWFVGGSEWRGWQPSNMRNITHITHLIHDQWRWPWLQAVIYCMSSPELINIQAQDAAYGPCFMLIFCTIRSICWPAALTRCNKT